MFRKKSKSPLPKPDIVFIGIEVNLSTTKKALESRVVPTNKDMLESWLSLNCVTSKFSIIGHRGASGRIYFSSSETNTIVQDPEFVIDLEFTFKKDYKPPIKTEIDAHFLYLSIDDLPLMAVPIEYLARLFNGEYVDEKGSLKCTESEVTVDVSNFNVNENYILTISSKTSSDSFSLENQVIKINGVAAGNNWESPQQYHSFNHDIKFG